MIKLRNNGEKEKERDRVYYTSWVGEAGKKLMMRAVNACSSDYKRTFPLAVCQLNQLFHSTPFFSLMISSLFIISVSTCYLERVVYSQFSRWKLYLKTRDTSVERVLIIAAQQQQTVMKCRFISFSRMRQQTPFSSTWRTHAAMPKKRMIGKNMEYRSIFAAIKSRR